MKKELKEMEKNVVDFREVSVEIEFDVFEKRNLGPLVGNTIHKGTGDIGTDDLARKIYHEGVAEIDEDRKKEILAIIDASNLVIGVKQAVRKLLS
jgi:predicted small secreted protein